MISGRFTVVARNESCMASENVRQLAREHPEAFRRVAEMRDDQVKEHLLQVLQEEQPQNADVPVSAD